MAKISGTKYDSIYIASPMYITRANKDLYLVCENSQRIPSVAHRVCIPKIPVKIILFKPRIIYLFGIRPYSFCLRPNDTVRLNRHSVVYTATSWRAIPRWCWSFVLILWIHVSISNPNKTQTRPEYQLWRLSRPRAITTSRILWHEKTVIRALTVIVINGSHHTLRELTTHLVPILWVT